MEFTIEASPSRSIVRRLAPWTMAMGLFAGGGYGVYRYAAPVLAGEFSAASTDPALERADVQQLFGAATSVKTDATAVGRTPTSDSRYGAATYAPAKYQTPSYETTRRASDRYGAASQLPPAAETTTAKPAAVTPVSAEVESTPADRYGAALMSPPVANVAPRSPKLGTITPADERPTASTSTTPVASPFAASAPAEDVKTASGAAQANSAASSAEANPLRGANSTSDSRRATPTTAELNARKETKAAAEEVRARAAFADEPAAKLIDAFPADEPAPAIAAGDDQYGALAARPLSSASPVTPAHGTPGQRQPAPAIAIAPQALAMSTPTPATPAPVSSASAPSLADQAAAAQPPRSFESITPTPGLVHADGAGRPGERSLEGTQTPSLTLRKLAPAEIQVGKKCTFAIRVTNSGPAAAHSVQVRDETPLGTRLVGASPKAAVSGASVLWDLGTLSPGEERVLEMELLPTDEGEIGSVATVSFSAAASAKARSTRPQLALRLASLPRVMAGDMQVVEVEVSNPGSGPATGVMLLETVPDGVLHEAGPALEFEVGTLAAGETRRLELNLKAEKAGRITNTMTARGDASLETTASCEFEIIAPGLEVTVDGPARRYLERPATYTLSVTNPGTAPAKEVQLITQLPKGLQFVSANNLGEYDAATHSVYWSLAELPPNEQGTVELTALAVEPGEQRLEVASRAQQGLEDRAETRIIVEGLAALSFEVRAVDQMVEVGGETAYEIRVTNGGSKAAANVQVTAIVPPGLRAIGGRGDAPHAVEGDRLIFAPVGQLAPKGEIKFRVEVQGVRPGDQRLRIEVASDDLREPMAKEEITRVYADD